jgi:hypothetical protein
MKKLIYVFVILIAVFNFYHELFFEWNDFSKSGLTIYFDVYSLFEFVNLKFFIFDGGESLSLNRNMNFYNLMFYSLFLLGLMLHFFSKGKEVRLLRFGFLVIFLSKCLAVLFLFYSAFFLMEWSNRSFYNLVIVTVLWSYKIIITCFIFKVIKYFDKEVQVKSEEETTVILKPKPVEEKLSAREILNQSFNKPKRDLNFKYYKASRSTRFFHLIFDNFICILICSSVLSMLMFVVEQNPEFENLRAFSEKDWSIFVLLILWRFAYYFTFETLFQTTPAKCLTSSKIISNDQNKLKPVHVFHRTWSRFIPFEALTFFGETGLHDKISETSVVKEQNAGVSSRYYFWLLIPIIAVLFYLFFKTF